MKLVLKLANENPSWGCDRLQSALANIGHTISDTSVRNILKANGIEPAPDRKRKTTRNTFLKAHWDVLAAIDFTTILRLPKRSPNLNGHMERFMRSLKEEALSQLVLFGEASLRNAVREYLEHYHTERNHQRVGNELLKSDVDIGQSVGEL